MDTGKNLLGETRQDHQERLPLVLLGESYSVDMGTRRIGDTELNLEQIKIFEHLGKLLSASGVEGGEGGTEAA